MFSRQLLPSARSCTCTCQASARYWPTRRFSAAIPSEVVQAEEPYEEDFHDRATASRLTARVQKSKKRIVKRGQDFVDKIHVQVSAGNGGDGGVAFHTEKFVANGPPSGGNGGQGGNVYIRPVTHLSSLSSLKKRMRAHNGQPGKGTWQHGRRGDDLVIEVPYGTVVRERRGASEFESEAEREVLEVTWNEWRRRIKKENVEDPEAAQVRRRKKFVLFPALLEDAEVLESKPLEELELSLLEEERRHLHARMSAPPLELDFDKPPDEATLRNEVLEDQKTLVCRGGQGGYGNPYFTGVLGEKRRPKFATRGRAGDDMRLEFELKTLADVGLVGLPNAGKSTILRALTHSKTTVASYAFTTLSPQIGTLIIYDDDTYSTIHSTSIIEESAIAPTDTPRDRSSRPVHKEARQERLRLTIADCPGLLPHASENVGLGHDFLRHIERSKVLVYVVDLSKRHPAKDLEILQSELEAYKPGLSERARIVIANKADNVDQKDEGVVQGMKAKLAMLRDVCERWAMQDGVRRVVLPISAKRRENVKVLVEHLVKGMEGETTEASEER